MKITKSRLKEIIREELLNEDSLGDKFQKTIQRYQDKVKKEREWEKVPQSETNP